MKRISQICVKRDQKAQYSLWIHFTGEALCSTQLTNWKINAIVFTEMSWHETLLKSKGGVGGQGGKYPKRGCTAEQPEGACKLSLTRALEIYYHIPQVRLNNGDKKVKQLYKWSITANSA